MVYFDWNCCEKQSRKKTSEYKISLRKHLRIAKKQCRSKKSSERVWEKIVIWRSKAKVPAFAGRTVAGKPASVATR